MPKHLGLLLAFDSITNPQTHLISKSMNACGIKIDFEGVNTKHRSDVWAVCLYKMRNVAFLSFIRHLNLRSILTPPGCYRSQHNSHHGCSYCKRNTCPGRGPSSHPQYTSCHKCCSSGLKPNILSQKIFPL